MTNITSVLILAGGFGKRIKGVWDSPKGLIPYQGKTILGVLLDEISDDRVAKNIVLLSNDSHYLAYKNYLDKNTWEVKLINNGAKEGEARGAIPDMLTGLGQITKGDVMILPCDTVTRRTFAFGDFADFGRTHRDGLSVVVREENPELIAGNFGNVTTDRESRITKFVEKPETPFSNLASAAMYYYPEKVITWIKEYAEQGENLDNPGRVIPWAIKMQKPVYGFRVKTGLVDVGRPESFYEIQDDHKP